MKLSTPNRFLVSGLVAGVLFLTACGDDESAQERYCNAGQDLEESVVALTNVDLVAEGTNGLESALNQIIDDVETLSDTATEASADEVDALESAVSGFEDAVESVGSELTAENVDGVLTALGSVVTAVDGLATTLQDCG